ncbi:hypothetical protein [Lentzea roselyniae]|uniref:hypothetical protein n=1 Tax=Lentzea roselyniae TaxID=531940 RepID=UPI0031FA2AFE
MARLVTAAAAVVGYVALILAITAGQDLRERNAFREAPAQYAAFVAALNTGSTTDLRAVASWFRKHSPSTSTAAASISLGASAAEDGDLDLARRYTDDVAAKIEQDQQALDRTTSEAWSRAVPWLLVIGTLLTAAALVLRHRRRAANAEVVELVLQYVPPKPRWRRPVFLVVSGIGHTLLVCGFLAVVAATRANDLPWAARGFLLAGGVAALPVACFVLRHSRPRAARGAAQALRADWRKPVLPARFRRRPGRRGRRRTAPARCRPGCSASTRGRSTSSGRSARSALSSRWAGRASGCRTSARRGSTCQVTTGSPVSCG